MAIIITLQSLTIFINLSICDRLNPVKTEKSRVLSHQHAKKPQTFPDYCPLR